MTARTSARDRASVRSLSVSLVFAAILGASPAPAPAGSTTPFRRQAEARPDHGNVPGTASPEPSRGKMAFYVYAREGDPLRFVYEVGHVQEMGIVAEGPCRARCFVVGPCYRDLTLGSCGSGRVTTDAYPQTIEQLAGRLDLRPDEVPADLVTIWRQGAVDWTPYDPNWSAPITGVEPQGPYRLVGGLHAGHLFVLAGGRGYLLVAYYGPELSRALRLPPSAEEFVVRPGAGLQEMIDRHHLRPSDICGHLRAIDRGTPVDWTDLHGYLY